MLKEGGRLVYSTCTFAPEEDEGTIEAFLRRHPEFELEEAKLAAGGASFGCGVPQWTPGGRAELARTCRIWPHKTRGEGHYLAARRKTAPSRTGKETWPAYVKDRETRQLWQAFQKTVLPGGSEDPCLSDGDHLVRFGDQLYRIPEEMPDCRGLKVLRPGLHLGTLKKGRLEPAHGLALYVKEGQGAEAVSLDPGGEAAARYLRGEALDRGECRLLRAGEEKGGWTLVTVDGRGRELGRVEMGMAQTVAVNGKYVAYLTGDGLTISGKRLEAWYTGQGAAAMVCICENGAAYLANARTAWRFSP